MSERTYSDVMDDFRQHIGANEAVATDPEDVYAIEAGIDKRFADELDAAHKREVEELKKRIGNEVKLRKTLVGIKSLIESVEEVTNDDANAILMNIDLALDFQTK